MKVSMVLLVCLMSFEGGFGGTEDADTYISRLMADLWLEGADIFKIIWRDCSKKLVDVKDVIDHNEYYPKFVRCMRRKTLKALDRSLSLDVVPIADGVNLVKFEMVDRSGNTLPTNNTSIWSESDLENGDWRTLALQRIARVLRTHVIKFDFDNNDIVEKVEERGRRRHHMMTMMMFGIVSIGMVLIPMGFQFLAVLGGKALLLAKMALILASIQGLKKIASSPLNYGFYHTYSPYEHFDKRSNDVFVGPPPAVSKAFNEQGHLYGILKDDDRKIKYMKANWKPIKALYESRQFSNVDEPSDLPVDNTFMESSLIDKTTRPGEVQADYSLELPYNGLHFQGPAAGVSS